MKRFSILIISGLITLSTNIVSAYDFEVDGIYYNLNVNDKTASVTFSSTSTKEYVGDIKIPSSVTYSNQNLPVVEIGRMAFIQCYDLESIEIPNSVTSIGNEAFSECTGLTSIIIPNSVTSIGNYAFYRCKGLNSITISNSVTSIEEATFYECEGLTSLSLPNSVTSIGDYAIYGCSGLTSMNIPNSVTSIGYAAFGECSGLTSVNIPNSVETIGKFAFYKCSGLTSMTIPNSVTSIEYATFVECSGMTSVTIPNSVTTIGDYAFSQCISLADITFDDGKETLNTGEYIFQDCPIQKLYLGRNISIPTLAFDSGPFVDNTEFKTISIGQNVLSASTLYPSESKDLEMINCYGTTPPKINKFTNVQYADLIVNIPVGSLSAYQNAEIWGNFWNLTESLPNPNIIAEEIMLNMESAQLNIGETLQLEATVLPEDATDKTVIWNSSNEEVASVTENGLVTAISQGSATITAICGEAVAECEIVVLDDAGIESLFTNPDLKISIYSLDGTLIKKDCTVEELKLLNKGIYIIVSGKDRYKISI